MDVTILMAVYNGARYLREAIDSILSQSISDFEFLIINDGSIDESKEIILSYKDSRIKYIENNLNLGLSASLNKGIDLARGEYIARMDCDDISLPQRLEKQINFLKNNEKVGIVGSWCKIIDSDVIYSYPVSNYDIKTELLINCALCHPAVMLRKSFLNSYNLRYDVSYKYSQDYDLWIRAQQYFDLANIDDVLLHYREHPAQMGQTFKTYKSLEPNQTRLIQLQEYTGSSSKSAEINTHQQVLNNQYNFTFQSFDIYSKWLQKIVDSNNVNRVYNPEKLNGYIDKLWFSALICIKNYNLKKLIYITNYNFYNALSLRQKLSFILKCILHKNVIS